jgi:hypothetical protein
LVSIIIGILGVLVGAVCAVFAYFQIREARRIAASSGSLKSPQLVVRYGTVPLGPDHGVKILYGMPKGFKMEYVGTLRMLIENSGKRAAENVKLEIVVPAGANSGSEFAEFRLAKGILPGGARECFRIGNLVHVFYHFPVINPGEIVSVDEPFWIMTTVDVPFSKVFPTADNKSVRVKGSFTIAFVFSIVLFHKEDMPWASKVEICVLEEPEPTTLANRWVKIEAEADGPFPDRGERDAQSRWIMGQLENKEVLLIIPSFELSAVKGKKKLYLENFEKSQRWRLSRNEQKWKLQGQKWTFH